MSAAPMFGGVMSAVGAFQQGNDTADALNRNAELQRHNAAQAIAASQQDAYKQGLTASKMLGGEQAGYAAAGVAHDSGSVADIISASAANAELDRQNILYGGKIREINSLNQAALDQASGANAKNAAGYNAWAYLFSGGAKTYGMTKGGGGTDSTAGGTVGNYAGPDTPMGGQA